MAYYLTPAERRARAQALIEQRKNVVAYNKYLKQQKDYERQVAQAKLDEENRQKQIESQDFFTRAISTVGDISANVITGALKGLEGIYDLGAGIVGAVGGIFSEDFQNSVKSHIATDWVGKYIGDPLQELTKYSYTKNGGIIEGVASGIGQMLPAVAVTIATGGAGAPAAVAQMASLATLGASAAGNATEEAFNDGASYYAGLGYGLASGAVEMATEKMFGGFGKLAGAGYLDNVTRSIAKQGFARVAKEAVEEGIEEVVSELANSALKAIYKGGEAFQEYGDPDYWKGVGQAGLIGGLTSMAYGQTVGRVLHSSGKYADVNEALAEVDSLAQKARNLSETGKLYEKAKNGKVNSDTIHDSMVENLRLIEKTVQKVDETKRAKFIKQAHLTDVVNADGSIKPEFAMSRGLSDMIVQQSTEGGETAQSPLASQPKQYRTAFADERVLKEALDRGGATAFVGEMTSEQTSDFSDFTKVFGKLANKSNGFLKFVVGENVAGNSYIDTQTGTVIMGVDQFGKGTSGVDLANAVITSDMWQKSAIHEVKHSTEGAKQDTKLTQHLYEDNAVFAEARDSFLRRGYFNERVGNDSAKAGEYLDSLLVKVDEVMRNKPKNVSMQEHIAANLTAEEIQDYRTAQSEIAAIAAENVLGNEAFIKKLLRKDTNIAQKVLNRIMDMKEAFASLKSKDARSAYTYLQKAEKLYLKAIEEVGAKFQKRRIIGIKRLEEGEEIDAAPQIVYNEEQEALQHSRKDSLINRTFPTYKESAGSEANTLATRWAHRADIKAGDQTLISYHDSWYVVQKFDDFDLGYQIMERIAQKDYDKIVEDIKRNGASGRIQSIQRAFTDFAQFDKQRNSARRSESSPHSLQVEHGGENSEVLRDSKTATPRGQTQNDGGGDSKSRRSSKQGLKYSLKAVEPVKPTSKAWSQTIDTDEALKRFPNLWNVKAEESEVRNPTQIKGTVSTYRKIYDVLKAEGFNGKILDASSGLGFGTKAGVDEYGFNIEDIEPYPDSKYKPKYTDYSSLNEKYDVIISNAVLNVLPQDQRDALVVKMGELLNEGGRLFVNVRGDDVNNLSSNPNNVHIGNMEWYVAPTGSYQKGFTRAELVAYLKDALGEGFSVVPTTLFGKSSAIVTKRSNGLKYSLKVGNEEIGGTVEETKNLVALHNLSEEKLLKVLQLGGFPMPSIAITKADMPYSDFGDITIIFGRETIDPKRSVANAIYSRDAWTPTVPHIDYKLNTKKAREIYKKIHGLLDSTQIERDFGYLSIDETNLQDYLNRDEGDVSKRFERDYSMKYAYLLDKGEKIDLPMTEKDYTSYAENGAIESVAKILDLKKIDEIREGGWTYDSVKAVLEDIKNAVNKYYAEKYHIENDLYSDMDYIKATEIIKAVRKYHLGETNARIDTKKAHEVIDKAVDMEGYKKWLKDLFSDLSEKRGIRNNADYYTPSGYARSFEALHYEYNLENIVKAMKSRASIADSNFTSPSTLAAALAKRFNSIEDLHAAEALLTEKPADLGMVGKQYNDMLYEIASSMVGKHYSLSDSLMLTDGAANVIQEVAEKGKRTAEDIYSYIHRNYSGTYEITKEIATKIQDLFSALSNAETNMFEAKPRRAVGFDEIKQVILPKTVSKEVISALEERGIDYSIYDDESRSRTDIIKSLDGIKFSLKDSEGKVLSEGQQKYFKDSKVRDNEGNLLVVYHGTMSGDFTVFDASYSNVESDMGAGFYFSSAYDDVNNNYENGGQDFEGKVERLAERIESDEEIGYEEAKKKARKQLARGSKLFEVYLDMKNPAYVGGNFDSQTMLFEDFFDYSDIQEEDFDSEDEYWEARDERVSETIDDLVWKVNSILDAEGITGYEGWEQLLAPIGAFYGGVTIEDLKAALNETESLWDCYDSQGKMATTEIMRAIIEALGYDGIIDNSVVDKFGYNSGRMEYMEGIDEETRHYIVFKPEQIKLTTNLNPTTNEDIRFSRKIADEPKRTYYHLSDGQIKKMLANSTRYKVYTKADAEGIINNVLQNYMSFGEKYGDISGKTKAQVIDMLWKGLNSAKPGYQMSVALNIADYIIQNSVLESLYEDMENYDVQQALDVIGALKPYLHNINLDSLKGEIKHKYDKDNSAYLLWGKRKGERGYGADQIAQELQERGIFIDAINEADIFFEIDAQYRNAVKALKKRAKEMLSESLPKEQQKALRQEIAREILRGFDYTGKSSQLAGVLDKYRKQIATLYDKLRDSKRHNQATNRLLDKVQKIKNWKTGAFVNSSKYRPKLFKGSIERLAMIKNRGNLNQSGTRRILAGLAEWYAKDNPILGYVDGENMGHYNEEIAAILQAVAQNQKPLTDEQIDLISFLQEKSGISDYKGLAEWYTKENLKKGYSADVKKLLRELASETTFTTEELIALDKAVGYFGNLIENHNKIIRNGKYVDAKPIAERYINTLRANKTVKVGWFGKFFDKVANNGKASYLQTFAGPMTVARYMDKYENGFFTEMLQEIREGAIRADVLEMNIRLPLEEFLSKHKKYGKGVSKRTVTYRGVELPALDAFLLYMTLNREQALAGLAEAGFAFNDGKETKRVNGFAKGEDLTLDELRERAKAEQEDLYKQFTEEDKEYISIAEKIFNEDCKETKRKTDMLRMGYSNVFDGYYVPIRRANSAVTVDTSTFFDEMNRVSNASFNKDTVQGAKGELFIGGLDEVLDRHIHGISQYASLATVIDQYDILYNINMTEDANKPQTVRTESENTWAKGNDYFKKLISDVQGISPTRGGGSKLFGFLRGGYAKYQLGLNPKVWLTQLSSIFASSSILDYSSIVKGFGIKSPDVDDYCSLAAVRNNDNSAAMAQSVLDKVDKFGSALMKPIGKVDRFVIKRLFGACQVQVQKENGLKVGAKENKIKAGELLEKVILETQQNSMATERSAAMRSGSELMKTLTMFTADSMKVFGRVVDSFGEVSVLKHKIKETTDPKVKESLQAQLKAANKKARKSVTALAATAIFMALVAQAFRWLYDRDDDDESVLETMTVDAIGNLMGGLPLIKDIYAKLTEGYDLNNYAYSAINDLFDAFASIVNFSGGKPAQKVKNIVYAVGQIFGIPTRNVYNIFYGLTKRFSPTTAYEIDNVFYNKNYASDLQKAIDNDDEDMIATIAGLMLDEKVGAIESTTAKRELNSLVASGYKVLPRSIGNTITYNGEEIALTSRQREQFKSVYSEANNALASLVEGKAYRSATEEVKAKAIAFIWDIYYNLAIEDLLGVDLETKNTLFAKAIDISSLAIIVATARGFEADTDKKGKVISGSRKAKVQGYVNSLGLKAAQKYMIMGYLGYSNKNGESQVRSYIQRLRLSKSEKEKLFEYSGYAA